MKTIQFGILADDADLPIAPLQELKTLIRAGYMPRLVSLYGSLGGGDCSAIAAAFMSDIAAIEERPPGSVLRYLWSPVTGHLPRIGSHTWLESDNFAFDLSHGDRRPAIVMRAAAYRAMRRVDRSPTLGRVETASGSGCPHPRV
jgi:hypothetical protein